MSSYECQICFDFFDGGANIPTSFPCGHSCCLKHTLDMMICHVCRQKLPDKLTPNIALRDLSVEHVALVNRMKKLEAALALVEVGAGLAVSAEAVRPEPSKTNIVEETHAPGTQAFEALDDPVVQFSTPAAASTATAAAESASTIDVAIVDVPLDSSTTTDTTQSAVHKKARKTRKKKKASSNGIVDCWFFRLLPFDLQVTILSDWLYVYIESSDEIAGNGLALVLSRLDVACCSRTLRPMFLALAKAARFDCLDWAGRGFIVSACSLRWLFTREVAVTVLHFDDRWAEYAQFPRELGIFLRFLNSVTTLNMTDRRHLSNVVGALPNISMIWLEFSDNYLPKENAWRVLQQHSNLPLTSIDISDCLDVATADVVRHHGPELLELALGSCDIVELFQTICCSISKHCPNLTKLTLTLMEDYDVASVNSIFSKCTLLTDLTLNKYPGSDIDLCTLLVECPALREFHLFNCDHDVNFKIMLLAEIVTLFPKLDLVKIEAGMFVFQRENARLSLCVDEGTRCTAFSSALKLFSQLSVHLCLHIFSVTHDMFLQICSQMTTMNLTRLSLTGNGTVFEEGPMVKFLCSCKSLKAVCGVATILSPNALRKVRKSSPDIEICPAC